MTHPMGYKAPCHDVVLDATLTDEDREAIAALWNNDLPDTVYISWIQDYNDLSLFDEAYQGKHDNDVAFAQDMADNLGTAEPSQAWPNYCIDWEYAARELMNDYTERGGHYFRQM